MDVNNDSIERIQQLAEQFRQAKSDFSWCVQFAVSEFPLGCCDDTSTLLGEYLHQQGVTGFESICGTKHHGLRPGRSHVWLQRDDLVVDITADQFNDEIQEPLAAVVVMQSSQWHQAFEEIGNRGHARIEAFPALSESAHAGLKAAYARVLGAIQHKDLVTA
jgi:hypothetical protein